jgi:hypothetical protein
MLNPLTITEMNTIEPTPIEKCWFIYRAIWVFSKNEKGQGVKNYLHLHRYAGEYCDFPSAFSAVESYGEAIKKMHRGRISTMSRSKDYCVDTWVAAAETFDYAEVHTTDCYAPDVCYVELIATTEALSLKNID